MTPRWRAGCMALSALCVGLAWAAVRGAAPHDWFADTLDLPALASQRLPHVETLAIAQAGSAWVAVGARGVVMRSQDQGGHWEQSPTPVSTDLVNVFFLNAAQGWAVGHDAVVLHTADGGLSWQRQLDGRMAAQVLQASYAALAQAGHPYARNASADLQRMFEVSGGQPIVSMPLLDVWFANAQEGWVVGAFNLLLHTRDGGQHWEAWDHLVDNPKALHLNAVKGGPNGLVIASEQGLVLRWNAPAQRFTAIPTDYNGTLFGVLNAPSGLTVFGLRGNARVSHDAGEHWQDIKLDTVASIVRVLPLPGGRHLYVLQDGKLVLQQAHGPMLPLLGQPQRPGEIYDAALLDNGQALLTVGLTGPVVLPLSGLAP